MFFASRTREILRLIRLGGMRYLRNCSLHCIIVILFYSIIVSLIYLFFIPEKVEKVDIDLENKKVFVTSMLSSDELLETIKKTGKETSYVGLKA